MLKLIHLSTSLEEDGGCRVAFGMCGAQAHVYEWQAVQCSHKTVRLLKVGVT